MYLDATGSVIQKSAQSPPYYVYELVVRNPSKGDSPLPVATYVTCDHTTASITYFLQSKNTKYIFFAQFHVQLSILHNFMNIYIHIQYLCKVFVQSQFVYV